MRYLHNIEANSKDFQNYKKICNPTIQLNIIFRYLSATNHPHYVIISAILKPHEVPILTSPLHFGNMPAKYNEFTRIRNFLYEKQLFLFLHLYFLSQSDHGDQTYCFRNYSVLMMITMAFISTQEDSIALFYVNPKFASIFSVSS